MSEFTGKGQGNLNTVLGTIGTIGAVGGAMMNGCGGLGGLFGGGCRNGCNNCGGCGSCSENTLVNRYEMTLVQDNAAKDAENALLRAQIYGDQKIVEAYKDLQGQINAVAAEVRANEKEQNGINMQQAVYNGTNTATIACIQGQVAQLMGLTKLIVPNGSVCPGWGEVTVAPKAATSTAGGNGNGNAA